jgi:hypothetical protein
MRNRIRRRAALAGCGSALLLLPSIASGAASGPLLTGATSQHQPAQLQLERSRRAVHAGTFAWRARCPDGTTTRGIILVPPTRLDGRRAFRVPLLRGSFISGRLVAPGVATGTLRVRTLAGCATPLVHWRVLAATSCQARHDCDHDDPPGPSVGDVDPRR